MLQVSTIKYRYNKDLELNFPSFELKDREELLITGKSGSGKTTLLHILGGLKNVDNGQIKLNNEDLNKLSEKQKDTFRGKEIGIIFQKPHLINSLNVIENLELTSWLSSKNKNREKCIQILKSLKLEDKLHSKINELSLGQQQRVSIARAVINSPSLILADEPTSSLDDENCELVIKLLRKSANIANANLIIVTHDNRLKKLIHNKIEL